MTDAAADRVTEHERGGQRRAFGACPVKSPVIAIFLMSAIAAACGGGGPAATPVPPTSAPGQATTAPVQPTTAPTSAPATAQAATPAPTNPGGSGGDVATVVLTDGADAGTYTASGNPSCSHGFVGTGVWGAQLTSDGAEGELSQLQVVFPDAGVEDAHLSLTLTIGPLMTGTTYRLFDVGTGQATDNGNTAVLHVSGTTDEGVGVDVTVNCPSVTRA